MEVPAMKPDQKPENPTAAKEHQHTRKKAQEATLRQREARRLPGLLQGPEDSLDKWFSV